MRIEIAVDARDGVGEGPFWDEAEQALWWVDILGKAVQRWSPATGARRQWLMPDFPSAVVLRRRGGAAPPPSVEAVATVTLGGTP